jgi:hypothetical protein
MTLSLPLPLDSNDPTVQLSGDVKSASAVVDCSRVVGQCSHQSARTSCTVRKNGASSPFIFLLSLHALHNNYILQIEKYAKALLRN